MQKYETMPFSVKLKYVFVCGVNVTVDILLAMSGRFKGLRTQQSRPVETRTSDPSVSS